MDASTKARVTGATEATGSIGANADESAIKVHKVTSTSSTLPCLHHYDSILWSKGQLLTHPCLTHSHGRSGGCTGPACTSQHPHMSSFTLHCSQHVLRGVSHTWGWFVLVFFVLFIQETGVAKKGRSSQSSQHSMLHTLYKKGKKGSLFECE